MPDSRQVAAAVVVLRPTESAAMTTASSGGILEEHRVLENAGGAGDGDETVIGVSSCCVESQADETGLGPVLQKADMLLDQGERHLVFNLGGISELGSDDVSALRRVQERCLNADGMLGLCEIPERVADELRALKIPISTYATEEEAVNSAGGRLRALLQRESQLSKISVVVHQLDLGEDISKAEFITAGPGDEWTSRAGELVVVPLRPGQEEALQSAVQPLISHGLHHLIIDLAAVSDGDAKSVLSAVDQAAGALQRWGGGVALVNVDTTVSPLLEFMDCFEGLSLFDNVDAVVDQYKEGLLESRYEETRATPAVGSDDGAEAQPPMAESFGDAARAGQVETTQELEALAAGLDFVDLEVSKSDFAGLEAVVAGHLEANKRHFTVRVTILGRLKVDEIEQLTAVQERVSASGGFLSLVDLPEEVSTWFMLLDLDKQFSVQADLAAARLAQARLLRDRARFEKEQSEQLKLDEERKQREWSDLLETLPEIEREAIELVEDAAGAEGRLYRAVALAEDGERRSVRVSMVDVTDESVGGLPPTARKLVAASEDHVLVNLHELGGMRGGRINALLDAALTLMDAGRVVVFCEPGLELTHLRKLMGFEKEIVVYDTEAEGLFGIALALFVKDAYSELELTSRRVPLEEPEVEVAKTVSEVEESDIETLESDIETLESEDEVEESDIEILESDIETLESEDEVEESADEVAPAEVVDAETELVQIETVDAPSETAEAVSESDSAEAWGPVEISEAATAFLEDLPGDTGEAIRALLGRGSLSVGVLLERAAETDQARASEPQDSGAEGVASATGELEAEFESLRGERGQLLERVAGLEKELGDARAGLGEAEAALSQEQSNRQQLEEVNALSDKEKQDLQSELDDAAGGLDRAREEGRLANEELEKAREELIQARGDLDQARSESRQASEKLEQIADEAKENREALQVARGEAAQARADGAKADEVLEEARAEAAKAGEALAEARAEVEQVKEDAANAGKSLEDARAEVEEAQAEAAKAGEALEGARAEVEEAQAEAAKASEALAEARAVVATAQADAITAGDSLEEGRAEVAEARAEATKAVEALGEARADFEQAREAEATKAVEALGEARADFEQAREEEATKAVEALDKVKGDVVKADEALSAARMEVGKAQEDAADTSTRLEQVREETSSRAQESESEVESLKAEVIRLTDDLAAAEELFEEHEGRASTDGEGSQDLAGSAQLEHSQRIAQGELGRLRGLEVLLREKLGMAQQHHAQLLQTALTGGDTQKLAHEKAQIIADAKTEIERLQHDKEVLREELESAGEMIERLGKELELG